MSRATQCPGCGLPLTVEDGQELAASVAIGAIPPQQWSVLISMLRSIQSLLFTLRSQMADQTQTLLAALSAAVSTLATDLQADFAALQNAAGLTADQQTAVNNIIGAINNLDAQAKAALNPTPAPTPTPTPAPKS